MGESIEKQNWQAFLRDFGDRNIGRPTRLAVFETIDGVSNDYWLEDGLRLIAVDEYRDHDRACVDIVLEKYRHSIRDVVDVKRFGSEGTEQGLDFLDASGHTTIVRFEDWPTEQGD